MLCIDEFELDDPGDTMLVSRLLTELTRAACHRGHVEHVARAARRGTFRRAGLPARDPEARVRVRAQSGSTVPTTATAIFRRHPSPTSEADLVEHAETTTGATLDDFDELWHISSTLHPSKYGTLSTGSRGVLDNVHPASDQAVALRMVVLADRLYDAGIPVMVSGGKLDKIFTEEMLAGGYRKKYLRATSRCSRCPVSPRRPISPSVEA